MKTKTYQYLVVILSLIMIFAASCVRDVAVDSTVTSASDAGTSLDTIAQVPDDAEETVIPEDAVIGRYRVTQVSDTLITLGDIVFETEAYFYDVDGIVKPIKGNIAVGDQLEITHQGLFSASIPAWFGEIYRIVRVTE